MRAQRPRLSKKPYKSEQDAYTILELTLTHALATSSSSSPSPPKPSTLSNRFLARSRIISKSIAALSAQHDLAPSYMEPIESALTTLSLPHIVLYTFSLDDAGPYELFYSNLAFYKDPETNMVEILSAYRWWDNVILRSTRLSQVRAKLYEQVMDKRKMAGGKWTVAEWLEKNKANLLAAGSEAPTLRGAASREI
jgi:hypothetical protein